MVYSAAMNQRRTLRTLPTQFGVLLVFALIPFWLRWDFAPSPFSSTYVLGFVISAVMLITVISWAISGFHGLRNFTRNPWRVAWIVTLFLLAGWAAISSGWAYGSDTGYAGLAPNTALRILLVTAFALVLACAAIPPRTILLVLIGSMLVHGAIGGLQVAQQSSLGLDWLGEFSLNPAESGVSVIQSGDVRWLRPYGFLPHPNVFAGIILVGLLASAVWIIEGRGWRYWGAMAVFFFGLWMLLLTFSRGAWLGFGVAVLFALVFVLQKENIWRRLLPLVIGSAILGIAFFALYSPLVLSRAGVGAENTEMRSIADRIVYTNIAHDAIASSPFTGIGAGNFPWYASVYIFYNTEYDLRGDNVHNIYLGLWADLGIIGLGLLLISLTSGAIAVLQQRDTARIALLAGAIAFAIIGFFDHYPWTLISTQTLWMSLLAVAASSPALELVAEQESAETAEPPHSPHP